MEPVWASVVVTALTGVASVGFGVALLRVLRCSQWPLNNISLQFVLGSGILGTLLFVVGLVRFDCVVIGTLLSVGAALFVLAHPRPVRHSAWASKLRRCVRYIRLYPGSVAVAVVGGMFALAACQPLLGGTGHDGISYHLLGPARWLSEGRIRPILGLGPNIVSGDGGDALRERAGIL